MLSALHNPPHQSHPTGPPTNTATASHPNYPQGTEEATRPEASRPTPKPGLLPNHDGTVRPRLISRRAGSLLSGLPRRGRRRRRACTRRMGRRLRGACHGRRWRRRVLGRRFHRRCLVRCRRITRPRRFHSRFDLHHERALRRRVMFLLLFLRLHAPDPGRLVTSQFLCPPALRPRDTLPSMTSARRRLPPLRVPAAPGSHRVRPVGLRSLSPA
jgi:hypothetical protein